MIIEKDSWDSEFFKDFISISHRLYSSHVDYIKESVEDFEKMLGQDAPFNKRNSWKAWIIKDEGRVIGRVFASTRIDEFKQNEFLPFGFFEALSEEVAKKLLSFVEAYAKDHDYTVLKGPIQGNVFNSSRFTTFQCRKRFLGEPLHQAEYIKFFEEAGYTVSQTWISAFFSFKDRVMGMYDYLKKYKKSEYRKKNYKIRYIDMNNWDKELELFYELIMDSYSIMDDVELISLDEFRVWNDSLKYILNPKDCLILEHEGEALGFLLAIRNRRRDIANLSKKSSLLNKVKFYLNHKFNRGTLLINYVGKKKGAEDKIKGVSIKLFNKMAKNHYGYIFTPSIFGFMSEKSKTMTIVTQAYTVTSKYCMFQKQLSS